MINLSEVTLNHKHPIHDQLAHDLERVRALANAPTVLLPLVEVVEAARHDRERYRGRRRAPGLLALLAADFLESLGRYAWEQWMTFALLATAYTAFCIGIVLAAR